ncbi:MAG: lysophospholipid acyltransferase family protein [Prevotella sp.]|nr:lysophospholipid acyltransferase family protein [Prevotella sp.]
MNNILYNIVYSIFYLFSLLPYRALYAFSDFMYIIVYYVVRYRRKIVRRNITTSFKEKTLDEVIEIEKGFYHWFCDYFVETIKLLSVSENELLKHLELVGLDEVEECFDEGQTCAGILGHYCNWELLSASALGLKRYGDDAICGLIYHPMHSAIFDRLFLKLRQNFKGVCVPKSDVPRYLLKYKGQGRMTLFGYIADQAPKYTNIHLWLDFLSHDTPVFTGGERIMRKMNNAVFYIDMQRKERGKYVYTYRLITKEPNKLPEFEITKRFFSLLEESIKKDPRFYFWTHDRWKRTREEFNREYKVENGRVVKR